MATLVKQFMILQTRGFLYDIPEDQQVKVMELATRTFRPPCDMVVFKLISNPPQPHETETVQYEDEGRTGVYHVRGLPKKVYAKLDDYGEPAKWNEMYEKEVANELRKAPNCRFTITFMLAEDY